MPTEKVILVDEFDQAIGEMEKLEAHKKGLLHRAFSVFIFNQNKQLLLQRRAINKYHCGGMWSNTCCSHPKPNETTIKAAHRRIREEMGFDCDLIPAFNFIYSVELDHDLIENEFDHVFFGTCQLSPKINRNEVSSWKYISIPKLRKLLKDAPGNYTPWLHKSIDKIEEFSETFFRIKNETNEFYY